MLLVVFSFQTKKNILISATQNIKEHEFDQYRVMFNSLQEGVLVIDETEIINKNSNKVFKHSIFFCNEI